MIKVAQVVLYQLSDKILNDEYYIQNLLPELSILSLALLNGRVKSGNENFCLWAGNFQPSSFPHNTLIRRSLNQKI